MAYTLTELGILENTPDNKFRLGTQLFALGKAAGSNSELIQIVHPYLEKINQKLKLSAFLGVLIKDRVVTVDKVDLPLHLKVSSEVGMATPILAGAVGKVILSKMPDDRIDKILSKYSLQKFTRYSCTSKKEYRETIKKARKDGFAFSNEEYIEGIRALAVPLNNYRGDLFVALYVVGLSSQIRDTDIESYSALLKQMAREIDTRLSLT